MKTWLMRRAVRRPVLEAVKLVGVQASLHQDFALAVMNELNGLCSGSVAVGRVDELERADLEVVLAGNGGDLRRRAYEDRHDDAFLSRLDRAAQRGLVAGVHHDRPRHRSALRFCDQAVVFRGARLGRHGKRADCGCVAVSRSQHDFLCTSGPRLPSRPLIARWVDVRHPNATRVFLLDHKGQFGIDAGSMGVRRPRRSG